MPMEDIIILLLNINTKRINEEVLFLSTNIPLFGVDGQYLYSPGYSGSLCEQFQRTFCLNSGRYRSACIVLNHTGDGFYLSRTDYVGPACEYITAIPCTNLCNKTQEKCLYSKDITEPY
ncbi:unnamed protein product [Rotaria magnacalcarata]|uniref:Uncharacterized protein n=1 Tax=Rotaria magnacalcarata TaxID=392030 RepID=A0A819RC93_9BILA|nr:unnamed protein product [Rotaria magnacalcarata]CAF4044983.1 unnamed protein product [Rotaria magnacalcarata]